MKNVLLFLVLLVIIPVTAWVGVLLYDATMRPPANQRGWDSNTMRVWEFKARMMIEELAERTEISEQLEKQMWGIVFEELQRYQQWDRGRNISSSLELALNHENWKKQDRAWYEGDLEKLHKLKQEYLEIAYGEGGRHPMSIADERIDAILSESQLDVFSQVRLEFKRAQECRDKNAESTAEAVWDSLDISDNLKETLKAISAHRVSASKFKYQLPLDLLIDEELEKMNFTWEQKDQILEIRSRYRGAFDETLDKYYQSVNEQLPRLEELCRRSCFEGEGDPLQQAIVDEKNALLDTDVLLKEFRKTVDELEGVLNEQQKADFQPIRDEALRKFEDYLSRSMTCENMDIYNEICEEPEKGDEDE